jgi:hypothetical protein
LMRFVWSSSLHFKAPKETFQKFESSFNMNWWFVFLVFLFCLSRVQLGINNDCFLVNYFWVGSFEFVLFFPRRSHNQQLSQWQITRNWQLHN